MKPFDFIIKNGQIIDGLRHIRFPADIGIVGNSIVAVEDLSAAQAIETLDATGKLITPGFIDAHTHSDAWLIQQPHFLPKTIQGYTTELLMLDGISYAPVNEETISDWIVYLRSLNGLRMRQYKGWKTITEYMNQFKHKNYQNTAAFIPYGNVRTLVCGFSPRRPDDLENKKIKNLVAQAMEEGACGLSTGFDYLGHFYSDTSEIISICTEIAAHGGIYVTHLRYKLGLLEALKEAIEIGRRAGIPIHISHLKGSTLDEAEAVLTYIDKIAVNEVDFSFDIYPYAASSTMLSSLLPFEVWSEGVFTSFKKLKEPRIRNLFELSLSKLPLDRITIAWVPSQDNKILQGQSLAAWIIQTGKSPADALIDLLIDESLAVLLVFHTGEDTIVSPFLAHPKSMIGSDGIYQEDGQIHPRLYGTAARILGKCVQEQHLFTLEDAVYKLSGFPARRFRLENRGSIQKDHFADLVVLDASTIDDPASFENPRQPALGISDVFVNGTRIIRDGQPVTSITSPLPGMFLRRGINSNL